MFLIEWIFELTLTAKARPHILWIGPFLANKVNFSSLLSYFVHFLFKMQMKLIFQLKEIKDFDE